MSQARPSRALLLLPLLAILVAIALLAWAMGNATLAPGGTAAPAGQVALGAPQAGEALDPDAEAGAAKRGATGGAAGQATVPITFSAPAAPAGGGFTAPARMGYTVGDQWEPAIATDASGHVYILYPQYGTVPGCSACASPTMVLLTSSDRGQTWSAPRIIYPAGATTGQWDAQITVDPLDGRTVYAAWLQDKKSSIAVAKSTDFGATWTVTTADQTNAGVDKDILAVRGNDVYVAYDHAQTVLVSASHDGGATWTETKVNPNGKLGWSLAGGGTVDPQGRVAFSWAGYTRNGGATGPVNLYVSTSADGGATWNSTVLDVSASPPDCSAFDCGWAFLGAQATLTSDASGTLYALWNAGYTPAGPERIWFSRSTDGGATWSPKADVSLAQTGVEHSFPAITAGGAGDVRIAWMDSRASGGLWNVWYRSSTDGGATWSDETRLSTGAAGYSYITPDGFAFPFGDYFEMDITDRGDTVAVWGEGANYDTPGSIWFVTGR